MVRIGDVPVIGSSTSQEYKVTLLQKPNDVLASDSDSIEKK